jgi:signal transduction histidine kinase
VRVAGATKDELWDLGYEGKTRVAKRRRPEAFWLCLGELGLGLTVSKSLLKAMGGVLGFHSQVGQGIFRIVLPYSTVLGEG